MQLKLVKVFLWLDSSEVLILGDIKVYAGSLCIIFATFLFSAEKYSPKDILVTSNF